MQKPVGHPKEAQRLIPREMIEFEPAKPLVLDRKMFLKSLLSAPRGASPGPGGCTYEPLRMLLDDFDTFELLFEAATSLAQASVPPDISPALMSARLTALTKLDGGGGDAGCPRDRNWILFEAAGGPNIGKAICIRVR